MTQKLMTLSSLIARRAKLNSKNALALASLRYEAVRGLSLNKIVAIHSTVLTSNTDDTLRNDTFDRLVDMAVISNANDESKRY